jgi:hypothetical protein
MISNKSMKASDGLEDLFQGKEIQERDVGDDEKAGIMIALIL